LFFLLKKRLSSNDLMTLGADNFSPGMPFYGQCYKTFYGRKLGPFRIS
jgi:hypothetical protein